jgi:hypothetical protein
MTAAARNKFSYRRTLVIGISGNLMESYDFAVYGYMVPIIGALFFPSDDLIATLIAMLTIPETRPRAAQGLRTS